MNEKLISSIKKKSYNISDWFEQHAKNIPIPFFSAVTIKDSGFKASISDLQLFPTGLNYLSKSDLAKAPLLIKKYFQRFHSDLGKLKKVLILVSVNHPNPFFYDHLEVLAKILKKGGMKVEYGTLNLVDKPVVIKTSSKKPITIYPTFVDNYHLKTSEYMPEFVLVADHFPTEEVIKLSNITQPVTPHRRALMNKRDKQSDHFSVFNRLVEDFSQMIDSDPWLMATRFQVEPHVNFDEKSGVEKVGRSTDAVLTDVNSKYTSYKIANKPGVQIRNNSGTYGMGRITVRSPKELGKIYIKKKKKKVNTKGQSVMNDVLIQEDIPVRPLFDKISGETVVYLIGTEILGGYIRSYSNNTSKNVSKSRNKLFHTLKFGKNKIQFKNKTDRKLGILYENISRIGGLAIGYEIDKKI